MQISDLPVHHKLIKTLLDKGFVQLTDVQQKSILPTLQGNDVLVQSQTGSGKTLAFLIPTLQRLLTTKALSKKDPRALIIAPTRELAKQVFQEAKSLCNGLNIRPALVIGGDNYNDQCKLLAKSPALIVGTAGRIADHLASRSFFLNGLEMLILDEADRMLDLGFADALLQINQQADHRKRQTLLFSATLEHVSVKQLASNMVQSPVRINVSVSTAKHENIKQSFYFADHVEQKDALLNTVLRETAYDQAIVFTATREDTDRLVALLNAHNDAKLQAIGLRGDLPQSQRNNVMTAFSKGQHSVLVTTDVASRGLDLPKVGLVVNFDLPPSPDEYIHRIGRTGRAGNSGVAVSLLGKRDWRNYTHIKSHIDYDITPVAHPDHTTKFTGIVAPESKRKHSKQVNRKKTTNAAPSPSIKKRIKTMDGAEAGNMPVMRKKRRNTPEE
ncbi:DEAD/DEAH box helicase [Alteromonas sediminis]|uniref:DEAD/DEAH box helicase n=1 Tax=Alteromonas sediminis TaxID=2259342 RepID=A0A3N5Y158_9ALTE|nr:DEAD/DEAH box helicase [Alteromonas sediminis]RPJ67312.1 DEAD/DEAH box helicase [Alteromonas sediminis]